MKYLILAGGKSTRFGRNKLEEEFDGKTLPQLAVEFAINNGATEIYLTLSKSGVKTDGNRVYHPILDSIKKICNPIVAFQTEETYGTAAALSTWLGVINEPLIVLFGDNYYYGKINQTYLDEFKNPNNPTTYLTTLNRVPSPRNLQLSVVVDGVVIEKPHGRVSGEFFCGLVRLPSNALCNLPDLLPSTRGEIEITDLINSLGSKTAIPLDKLGVGWDELTYETDVKRIQSLVKKQYEG